MPTAGKGFCSIHANNPDALSVLLPAPADPPCSVVTSVVTLAALIMGVPCGVNVLAAVSAACASPALIATLLIARSKAGVAAPAVTMAAAAEMINGAAK